jgi:purine-cytosine permease-like protein
MMMMMIIIIIIIITTTTIDIYSVSHSLTNPGFL